ncbi:hypothetical protein CDAR_239821 [Caerostris darwini]|uniref:Uncharacterized protein n=1 Tax=Caerostris darwini TaxID=1538125 RepID=A0AAV4QXM0_9ARAC|nr:hypothetical protein CDAR_239821 [Caerostris darwini]
MGRPIQAFTGRYECGARSVFDRIHPLDAIQMKAFDEASIGSRMASGINLLTPESLGMGLGGVLEGESMLPDTAAALGLQEGVYDEWELDMRPGGLRSLKWGVPYSSMFSLLLSMQFLTKAVSFVPMGFFNWGEGSSVQKDFI